MPLQHLPAVPDRASEEPGRSPACRRASDPACIRYVIAVPWHYAALASQTEAIPGRDARDLSRPV
jgi:hypothetical protein